MYIRWQIRTYVHVHMLANMNVKVQFFQPLHVRRKTYTFILTTPVGYMYIYHSYYANNSVFLGTVVYSHIFILQQKYIETHMGVLCSNIYQINACWVNVNQAMLHVHVCMYVCMWCMNAANVCMCIYRKIQHDNAHMRVWTQWCMCVCVYIYMYIHTQTYNILGKILQDNEHIRVWTQIYIYIYIYIYIWENATRRCTHACMNVPYLLSLLPST
jgi:hypothetical protein